jgi:hypothetical protein
MFGCQWHAPCELRASAWVDIFLESCAPETNSHIPQPVRRALVGCRGFKALVQELEKGQQPRGGHLEAVEDRRSQAGLGLAQEVGTTLTGGSAAPCQRRGAAASD